MHYFAEKNTQNLEKVEMVWKKMYSPIQLLPKDFIFRRGDGEVKFPLRY